MLNKIRGFLKDKKGGSEVLAFTAVIIVLVVFLQNIFPPLTALSNYSAINSVQRRGLLEMESQGGLTAEIEDRLYTQLEARGLDRENVNIVGTHADYENYGSPIELEIQYTYNLSQLGLENGFNIYKLYDSEQTMSASGSTISFTYERTSD